MTAISDRFRSAASTFTTKVEEVPDDAWDNPAPCEGWVARDVVRHLVEWPASLLFDRWGIDRPVGPSVDDDPLGAWIALRDTIQDALDDPVVASRIEETQLGQQSFEQVVDMICTSDVFLHTWDLARATGLDERLDPAEVHRLLVDMEPMDQVLRDSGHFGPRTPVAEDADEQTRLLAFIGRRP